ncbi:hypothetical protein GCM10020331_038120 [Ectobacillus funiculus]
MSWGENPIRLTGLALRTEGSRSQKNYRVVTEVASEGKQVAIVKVGAMFVNSIELLHRNDALQKKEKKWLTSHLAQPLSFYSSATWWK